ncbi:protein induced by osmotic stress [Scheffersomyces coipomensis]|uniref:protein induced by osmotic stress n=1 Tax=Scheffersomyces coipomensis TaxID=1788519 RepID=UPI00315CCEF4
MSKLSRTYAKQSVYNSHITTQSIFISGATGYIAQHIILQLLARGDKVVGQVRSAAKGDSFVKDFNNKNFSYEIVKVLEQEGAFDDVLAKHPEVTVFIHTASPVNFDIEDNERDILIPAIKGTKNVLASIKKSTPQIKRVVVTSSVVAAATHSELEDPKYVGGEDSWLPTTYEEGKSADAQSAYATSKKYAELAAWEFVKEEKPNFILSSVLPGYVFGPQAFESGLENLNLTAAVVANALQLKKDDEVPIFGGVSVDVRDIALAHIYAFDKEETAGKRLVGYNNRFLFQQVVDVIRKNFKDLTDVLPVGNPIAPDHFDTYNPFVDVESRKALGIDYIPFEKTIVEHITQILDHQKK